MFCTSSEKLLIFKLSPGHFFYYPDKPDGSKPGLRNFWPCFNCIIIMETSDIRLSTTTRHRSVLCWFLYHADRECILISDQWFLPVKGHLFPVFSLWHHLALLSEIHYEKRNIIQTRMSSKALFSEKSLESMGQLQPHLNISFTKSSIILLQFSLTKCLSDPWELRAPFPMPWVKPGTILPWRLEFGLELPVILDFRRRLLDFRDRSQATVDIEETV